MCKINRKLSADALRKLDVETTKAIAKAIGANLNIETDIEWHQGEYWSWPYVAQIKRKPGYFWGEWKHRHELAEVNIDATHVCLDLHDAKVEESALRICKKVASRYDKEITIMQHYLVGEGEK